MIGPRSRVNHTGVAQLFALVAGWEEPDECEGISSESFSGAVGSEVA